MQETLQRTLHMDNICLRIHQTSCYQGFLLTLITPYSEDATIQNYRWMHLQKLTYYPLVLQMPGEPLQNL